jgi:hypothetical protein
VLGYGESPTSGGLARAAGFGCGSGRRGLALRQLDAGVGERGPGLA